MFVEVELPGPLAHRDHNLHHNEDDDDPLQKRAVLRIKLVVQQLLQVHAYNVYDDIASQRHRGYSSRTLVRAVRTCESVNTQAHG